MPYALADVFQSVMMMVPDSSSSMRSVAPIMGSWQILYIKAERLLDGYEPEIVIRQFVIPGGQKVDTAYEKCLKVL